MKVVAIHVAPGSRIPVRAIEAVDADAGKGLVGDRYHGTKHRHVTIQSKELLDRAADDLGYGFVRVSAPCRLLDDFVGPGAAAALRRRAGSTCRLLSSGTIRIGDNVESLPELAT